MVIRNKLFDIHKQKNRHGNKTLQEKQGSGNMYSEAYDSWVSIFTDDVAEVWSREAEGTQKLAMILHALKKEFKAIESGFEEKLRLLRQKQSVGGDERQEKSIIAARLTPRIEKSPMKTLELQKSPKIGRNLARGKKFQSPMLCFDKLPGKSPKDRPFSSNYAALETTVIECTPPEAKRASISNKARKRLKLPKSSSMKNSTLTQMLSTMRNNETSMEKSRGEHLESPPVMSSQETFVDENLLQNANRNKAPKKTSPNFVHKMEALRGKKRKEVDGWACRDCEKFYEGLNLPPEELHRKMRECSRHRGKFAPAYETPAAYLAMDITCTENNSLIL